MNYRHIYHAGNICDVVKHAAFALLLEHMKRKEKPFAVLDTHAGCGLYDLEDERAKKTAEAEQGVKKLWGRKEESAVLAPYRQIIEALKPLYPGSPVLARRLMRDQDRLILCELHPEDVETLRRVMRKEKGSVQIHHRDGYEALRAFLPFPEKRGLILIDPPFETGDEIARLIEAVQEIAKRMPSALTAIWYPIKDRPAIWRFHEGLREADLPEILKAEFIYEPEVRADRLNGSGLILLNPPWKIEEDLQSLFAALHEAFDTAYQGSIIDFLSKA